MNYNDSILENKTFNFFKELLHNIVMAIFVLLVFAVVMVLVFNFKPYTVLSDSQAPYFTEKDIIIVKQQNQYKEGNIIKFTQSSDGVIKPVTHRLIAVVNDNNGVTHYICHGDNVQNTDASYDHIYDYQWEIDRLKNQDYEWIKANCINIQDVKLSQIEGSVVAVLRNYGSYYNFITQYKFLLITIVLGLWCFTYTMQNELEIKKTRRLL